MNKPLGSTLIGVLLTALAPATASARPPATALDAMQPLADASSGTLAIGGASGQRLAQTFSAELSGRLTGVFLPLRCDSGHLVLEIREMEGDLPGDVSVVSQVVPAAQVRRLDFHFQLFDLGGGVAVAPGTRLALVLSNPDGVCGIARGPVGDGYADGAGYFEASPNEPGWIPLATTETRHDHPFLVAVKVR
jgi:hypothetical protein